jgi:ACS family hexuronate transporter-like MFS transporter
MIIGALRPLFDGFWVLCMINPTHRRVSVGRIRVYIQQDTVADSKLEGYVPETTTRFL